MTTAISAADGGRGTALRRLSTFRVDEVLYGVDVDRVQEVTKALPVTTVPQAPAGVTGLVNLRGQVVTVVDLRHRLGLPARSDDAGGYHVVLRSEGAALSLLVDAVEGFEEVPEDAFTERPDTVPGPARDIVPGVYPLADELLLVVDVDRAIDVES